MRSIVIATDGSSGSSEAVEQGLELASQTGARVAIVYVRRRPSPFLGDPYYQDVITEEARHTRGVIADAKLHATRYDVAPEYAAVEGDPVEAILEFAEGRDTDLIVVGSRGLGRVAGMLLGSVSRELVQRSDRPVLVVKRRLAAAA